MATAAASASRRRRDQREFVISWGAVFCFGGRRGRGEEAPAPEGTAPRERSSRTTRRRKRTVPVDGDLVAGTAGRDVMTRRADDEGSPTPRGPRFLGCCFLPPARAPAGRTKRTMDSSGTHSKQRQLEHAEQQQRRRARSPSEAPATWRIRATDGGGPAGTRAPTSTRPCSSEGPSGSEASACAKASAGVGAFGPEVGLAVVTAVSMAGLLGGRLWAVACVCAWLAALSRLRRREARPAAALRDSAGE